MPTIDLAELADTGEGALLAMTRDEYGRVTGTRAATITGTQGRVVVGNGDAVAGLPTIDLAELADGGAGQALFKITRDAYGRVAGTAAASLDDLADVQAVEPNALDVLAWNSAAEHWAPRRIGVPYFVPANTVYVVPENRQDLFTLPIDLGEGASIELAGALVEVA